MTIKTRAKLLVFGNVTFAAMTVVFNVIAMTLTSIEILSSKCQCQVFDDSAMHDFIDNSVKRFPREIAETPQSESSSSVVRLKHQSPELVLRTISRISQKNVEELYLENNGLTNLPRTLGGLSKIESISLADNKIADISAVSVINGFTRLRILVLSRNPLKNLRGLNIVSLENLQADNCEIDEIDNILPDSLPALRKLNLTGNRLGSIRKLISQSLIELVLQNCHLSHLHAEAFRGLTNLNHLNLRENNLNTMPDTIFLRNYHLRYLNLGQNRLKTVTKAWFDYMQNLETLDLSKNAITSIDETHFARLVGLAKLNLAGNKVTKLINLETAAIDVNFSKNSIANNETWNLSKMTRIRRLDLSHNRLEGNCSAFRSNSLNILILGHNQLSTLTKESVSALPNLTDVNLKGNKISGGISPTIFSNNPNVLNVELDDNPWNCNCTELYPLYYYLASGQRTTTNSLVCDSPKNASGRTWWGFCGQFWRQLMVIDDQDERALTWIIGISAVFGGAVIFGTMVYITYTFKQNRPIQSGDVTNQ